MSALRQFASVPVLMPMSSETSSGVRTRFRGISFMLAPTHQ